MYKNHCKSGLLLLASAALFIASCQRDPLWLRGKGDIVSVEHQVDEFTGISLDLPATLHYEKGSTYSLRIEAQANVGSHIRVNKSGSVLGISWRPGLRVRSHKPIHIYLVAPDLSRFTVNGSGSIDAKGNLFVTSMKLDVNGSGKINLQSTDADLVNAAVNGSGNIAISGGRSTRIIADVNGSGEITAADLEAETARAVIHGSGSISLKVTQELDAEINGSGRIRYKGQPAVRASVNGSGKIINTP
jgi:hypothetical protein